ncbi:polysaccharide deacetylase family protein [Gallaecimonas xiamenensis]|uniref:Polysaccharide deacetylase n=1 Tax=Gallaecimonas xiamenensis 3-C-1 TaxID=745411 RepID=K2J2K9_9GAMM|nr:polysaccharide deacetylase family protein [Gallaecimonas xiamenensis]EKE77171.1 polysaccharide deacetylase [Gallaecimonas xiamenensis 3-C-1]
MSLSIKSVVLGLIALLVVLLGTWQLVNSRQVQLFGELVNRVDTDQKVIALTFDDGPAPGNTEAVLTMLAAEDVKATFFLVGSAMELHPRETMLIANAGHEIGNHSYSHQRMVLMSPGAVREELERTDALIRQSGYQGPILFRPPYGKKFVMLPWYLSHRDMTSVTWDLEPESHGDIAGNSQAITRYVLDKAKPGSILLLHVMFRSRQASLDAVPGIIEGLKAKGYRLVTVSELLALRP